MNTAHQKTRPSDPVSPIPHLGIRDVGMTKREYMATAILQGLTTREYRTSDATLVREAICLTDELIKQLNE